MTCLEVFRLLHQERIDETDDAIVELCCPHEFELLEVPEDCSLDSFSIEKCWKCWNRDVQEYINANEKKGENEMAMDDIELKINTEPTILDSGDRTEFESGAVRDMRVGKGRCDLLPLDEVAMFYKKENELGDHKFWIFARIDEFMDNGACNNLYEVLDICSAGMFENAETMFLEVAKHFEEGAKKYGDNNWRKGIPANVYIDSATRHYLKYLRGDKDERHDRAFVWNILCCIWTCANMPELNTYAKRQEVTNG